MDPKWITWAFIAGVALLVLAFDLAVLLSLGREFTITHVVREFSFKHSAVRWLALPLFAFLWCHLFTRWCP